MASVSDEAQVTPLKEEDYEQWNRLLHAYIDFYKTKLPEEQYRKTFDRIMDPNKDLYALGLRQPDGSLIGFAHYFPHQTPWSERKIMHFNDLFIDPELRGKGYGRKVMQAVAEEARKAGCYRLQWTTQHGNPARKLYDQLGTSEFVQYRQELG